MLVRGGGGTRLCVNCVCVLLCLRALVALFVCVHSTETCSPVQYFECVYTNECL